MQDYARRPKSRRATKRLALTVATVCAAAVVFGQVLPPDWWWPYQNHNPCPGGEGPGYVCPPPPLKGCYLVENQNCHLWKLCPASGGANAGRHPNPSQDELTPGGATPGGGGTKDPVHVISGSVRVDEIDIIIPCPLINLYFSRSYNSNFKYNGPLGRRWTHSYDWTAREVTNAVIKGVQGDWMALQAVADPWLGPYEGDIRWFRRQGDGTYKIRGDVGYRLVKKEDDRHEALIPGGISYLFATNGLLEKISHAGGQSVTLSYSNNLPSRVEHSNGQYLEFTYAGDRIAHVATPATNLFLAFSYGESGELTNVVRQTPRGAFEISYSYDSPQGYSDFRLTKRINANGDVSRYDYARFGGYQAQANNVVIEPGYWRTRLEYPTTNRTVVTYRREELDQRLDYNYDPVIRRLTRIVGPVNTNWVEQRDYDGEINVTNLVVSDNSLGEYVAARRAFDDNHNVTNEAFGYCSAPDAAWQYEWNADHQTLRRIDDPEGHAIEFDYTNALLSAIKLAATSNETLETRLSYTTNGLLEAVTNANGHWVRYAYDPSGYVTNIAPQEGPAIGLGRNTLGFVDEIRLPGEAGERTIGMDVDERGRILSIVYPNNLSESFDYDAYGNLLTALDTAGRVTTFSYLPAGRNLRAGTQILESETTNQSVAVNIEYDEQQNLLKIIDSLGRQVETYQLDNADRVVGVMNIESQQMSVAYGVSGHVNSVTRFDGSEVVFAYNPQGWVSEVWCGSTTNTYGYYANGLIMHVGHESSAISNEYDSAGRLLKAAGAGPTGTVNYTYFPASQVSKVASVAGATVYSYDPGERISSIQVSGFSPQPSFGFGYNPYNGMIAAVTNGAGLVVQYSYDVVDRLIGMVWMDGVSNTVRSFSYAYDNGGMITQKISLAGSDTNVERYAYDSLYRLTKETRLDTTNGVIYEKAYKYDLAGNRTAVVENGVSNNCTLALGNRLATFGPGASVEYGPAGNATSIVYSASNRIDLMWNEWYELNGVTTNGTPAECYGNDPLGRRLWTSWGIVTNFHVYDGIHCIADVDAGGGLIRSYVWGPGIDNLLSMTVHTGPTAVTYYPITDHLGTVHALADSTANVVESYKFDAWGRVLEVRDSAGELSFFGGQWCSPLGNRYLWQGREYSWASGFYYFRARWYDPVTGRWLSNDPIGISGALNQYVFCNDCPVNFEDPDGRYGNPISGGGTDVYYPSGGWLSVNGPSYVALEHRSTSGFANAYRVSEPVILAFGVSGVAVGAGYVMFKSWPVILAGGPMLWQKGRDVMYRLMTWQPGALLDRMYNTTSLQGSYLNAQWVNTPYSHATFAELTSALSPYASQLAAGTIPGPGGPFANRAEAGIWFSSWFLSGGPSQTIESWGDPLSSEHRDYK